MSQLDAGKKQTKALREQFEEPKNINASRRAALKRITNAHGSEVLGVIREKEFIQSSSIGLNHILGGGWCRGRIHQVAGKYSSGKTILTFDAIANAQRQYPEMFAYYVDAEETYDPVWAAKFGVDNSRLDVIHPPNMQACYDEMYELCMSGAYIMGALDSTAALITAEELMLDTASGKDRMGLSAGVMGAGLRKLVKGSATSKTAIILINQIRDSMALYGPKTYTPGGNALKHACSAMLELTVKSGSEKKDGPNEEITGHTIGIYVSKNKLGFPKRRTEIDLSFTKAFDRVSELRKLAIEREIVTRDSKTKEYKLNGKVIANGIAEFNRIVGGDQKLWSKLYEAVDKSMKEENKLDPKEEYDTITKDAPDSADGEIEPLKDLGGDI